jgi:hypothetical protein
MATSIACLCIGWFASRAVHASYTPPKGNAMAPGGANNPPPSDPLSPSTAAKSSLAERIDRISQQLANVGSQTETVMAAFALGETLQSDEFPAAIATVASSANFRGAHSLLLGYWMERDREKALRWYESLDPSKRSTFSGPLLDTWSAMDPGAALAWLEKQPDAERQAMLRSEQYTVARRIGPTAPDRVLALLMSVAGDSMMIGRTPESGVYSSPSAMGGTQSGVYVFFWALADKAPEDAAERALKFPSGTHRTSAAIAVARAWAKQNPSAAKAWAEKIDDAALSAQVIPSCALGLAEKDAKQAAEWLGGMPATRPNREAMKDILDGWGQRDLGAALSWLDSLPPDSGAEELTGAVFKTLNRQDPVKALDVMKQRLDEGKPLGGDFTNWIGFAYVEAKGPREALRFAETSLQHEGSWESVTAFRSLVNAAAQQIPKETAEWASKQPAGERRSAALGLAGSFLVKENEEDGYRWINSLPRDADSNQVRIDMIDRFFRKDPDKGVSLLAGLTDQEDAKRRLFNCTCWGLVGEQAAQVETWFEQTSALSADEKARVRREVAAHKKKFGK